MHNILLVGAGQLGSRHLQGAVKSGLPLNITVIDPSTESLSLAKERLEEVEIGNPKTTISFSEQISEGMACEICIIATTANYRFDVFMEVIQKTNVKKFILEKVLFQKESEYFIVEEKLNYYGIKAWVNCPRRMFPFYKHLKSLINKNEQISLTVDGSNWGMACNTIHFIDLFSFLTESFKIKNFSTSLVNELEHSKREDFYEVFGQTEYIDDQNNRLKISCNKRDEVEVSIHFKTSSLEFLLCESTQTINIIKNNGALNKDFEPQFQSSLTYLNIEEILNNNNCSLTPYSESKDMHLSFLPILKQHFEQLMGKNLSHCPIT